MSKPQPEYVTTYENRGEISVYSMIGRVEKVYALEAYQLTLNKLRLDRLDTIKALKKNPRWVAVTEGMTDSEVEKVYADKLGYNIDRYSETLKLSTWDEFMVEQGKRFDAKPVQLTDKQGWWDALECLPPLLWDRAGSLEYFFMSEFYTGDYTSMYVCLRTDSGTTEEGATYLYASKTVNINNKSSWITAEQVLAAKKVKDLRATEEPARGN